MTKTISLDLLCHSRNLWFILWPLWILFLIHNLCPLCYRVSQKGRIVGGHTVFLLSNRSGNRSFSALTSLKAHNHSKHILLTSVSRWGKLGLLHLCKKRKKLPLLTDRGKRLSSQDVLQCDEGKSRDCRRKKLFEKGVSEKRIVWCGYVGHVQHGHQGNCSLKAEKSEMKLWPCRCLHYAHFMLCLQPRADKCICLSWQWETIQGRSKNTHTCTHAYRLVNSPSP